MKIIILEGIATSGKTTLTKELSKNILELGKTVTVIDEEKTLIPVLNDRSVSANRDICKKVANAISDSKTDYVILDRYYFTHVFRTDAPENEYECILDFLIGMDPLCVLLVVKEQKIGQRLFDSFAHRDPSWAEFVLKKGETKEDITNYYLEQQEIFKKLFSRTSLRKLVLDTTENNYSDLAKEIFLKA